MKYEHTWEIVRTRSGSIIEDFHKLMELLNDGWEIASGVTVDDKINYILRRPKKGKK